VRALLERIPTAQQYYRLTGSSFRALCPEKSGHMNMGLWPAPTLRAAQEDLIALAFGAAAKLYDRQAIACPRGVIDLGCGWGGTGRLWAEAFPFVPYLGVNASSEQVATARSCARPTDQVRYLVARAEEDRVPWKSADLAISIEAMFHFVDKARIIEAMTPHVKGAVLLEICVENRQVIDNPLLTPSLHSAWTTTRYEQAFAQNGWSAVRFEDIGSRVFDGFLDYARSIDEAFYDGRRAILRQLIEASQALAEAHARGDLRYVTIVADR
jgi:hypothetical protein